jgi:DNA-directed RNA polymerase specialized sigma24 family protein
VLVALYRKWSAGEPLPPLTGRCLPPLVGSLVHNKAIDAARRAYRRQRERPAPHESASMRGTSQALDRYEAFVTSTSTRLARLDARERVREILDFLAAREEEPNGKGDYELLVLRHVDGLAFREIAVRRGLGETAEAVRSRLRRLARAIAEAFPVPPPASESV